MSLTHVCVWDDKTGYRRITIDEACKLYPYGVSARSETFVCELCGQTVCLSSPGCNARHFRHNSVEEDKNCEERQLAYGYSVRHLNQHPMPLRIQVNGSEFLLQLGFFRIPATGNIQPRCRTIKIAGDSHQVYAYSFERIDERGVTYLNVGNLPSKTYTLVYDQPSGRLDSYWPTATPGVDPAGSFFSCDTGRMIPHGGKITPYKSYYLLQKNAVFSFPSGIEYKKLTSVQSNSYTTWYLYQIKITDFNARVARFFLRRSVFLSEVTNEFYPIWPVYVEDPYFVYHNTPKLYFYLQGQAELKTFPVSTSGYDSRCSILEGGRLYSLMTKNREQLLSLGQSGTTDFLYLRKKEFTARAALPHVHVLNVENKELKNQVYTDLPPKQTLTIEAPYDGTVMVYWKGNLVEKRLLMARQKITVDGLRRQTEIQIYQGCDLVRSIQFAPAPAKSDGLEDSVLVKSLRSCSGPMIPVPHSIGAMAHDLQQYPKTKAWLYEQCRRGTMSIEACKRLTTWNQQHRSVKKQ